jgi:saccharopine dehydrogenase-like NADP-dependent oxidoreductase
VQIVVLGAGRVGGAIVRDLSEEAEFSVAVADLDPLAADRLADFDVEIRLHDLSHPAGVVEAIRDADVVVGCVPGFMGYRTVEVALGEGKAVVDISRFEENAFDLDDLARRT